MTQPSAWAMQQALFSLWSAQERMVNRARDAEAIDDIDHDTTELTAAEEDVEKLLHRTVRAAQRWREMSIEADARARRLADRADRFEVYARDLRGAAFAAMDALGMKRLDLPDITVSMVKPRPSVVITDEAALPAQYLRTNITPNIAAIGANLREGIVIPGAELQNGMPTIQIRST